MSIQWTVPEEDLKVASVVYLTMNDNFWDLWRDETMCVVKSDSQSAMTAFLVRIAAFASDARCHSALSDWNTPYMDGNARSLA